MPGARMQMIVVMKLTAPRMVPKPPRARPKTHRSPPTPGAVGRRRTAARRRTSRTTAAPCGVRKPAAGDEAAEEVQPVGEHVQPRERDVGRADLQRHDRVGEAGEQRRREQQQHDRAVHGEQLVVLLRVVARSACPGSNSSARMSSAMHAADAEEDERGDEVQVADHLVVGGGDPLDDRGALGDARARDRPALRRSAVGSLAALIVSCSLRSVGGWSSVVHDLLAVERRCRAGRSGPAACSSAMCASYSACETTLTLNSICEWYAPHSSAHLPL